MTHEEKVVEWGLEGTFFDANLPTPPIRNVPISGPGLHDTWLNLLGFKETDSFHVLDIGLHI